MPSAPLVHRNRVIYQSEALFISPDSTGYHHTGVAPQRYGLMTPPLSGGMVSGITGLNTRGELVGWQCGDTWPAWNPNAEGLAGSSGAASGHGTIIKQLQRVQTANYGFTVNRTDINQFGHLARLDAIVLESPTVNLDFSYYLTDGGNERQLEFVTDGTTNTLSGAMAPELYQAGNNFFILTVPEARDAVGGDVKIGAAGDEDNKTVIALGNGYITDYSVDISVGGIPTASVTVEGMNLTSQFGETGLDLPGLDMRDGSLISDAWSGSQGICAGPSAKCTGLFSLPAASSGYAGCGVGNDVAALRPGDVVVNLRDAGLISKQVSGDANTPLVGSAHIQSASISLPMSRSTLQRLGSTFGFSKALDTPMTATLTVSALLSELKAARLTDLICSCEEYDLSVTLYDPECPDCTTKDGVIAMVYTLKGAKLDSESFSSTIGDNKTVDLSFSTQIGGADDPSNGVYISGREGAASNGLPPAWTGIGGYVNRPATIDGATKVLGYRG